MKKIILFTIFTVLSLLILRFILIGFIAYTQRPHLSAAQWYGNYFDRSMNEKEKVIIGNDSCATDTLKSNLYFFTNPISNFIGFIKPFSIRSQILGDNF